MTMKFALKNCLFIIHLLSYNLVSAQTSHINASTSVYCHMYSRECILPVRMEQHSVNTLKVQSMHESLVDVRDFLLFLKIQIES